LEGSLAAFKEVSVRRTLNGYPSETELVRTLRANAPDVVFLSFDSLEKANFIVKVLEKEAEGIQVVAIHRAYDPQLLRETMRAGVREFLCDPFEQRLVGESLGQVKELLERKPPSHGATNEMFCFLPSKAGVGTSTVALNVSAALARRPETRVLLSDFDLNSGMMRFMLKLQNEYSVSDAAEHALHLDENLWPPLVTSIDRLDVLHAGRVNPQFRIESAQIRGLVEFMRRNYDALCFDLSGNLERFSVEIMQECKNIMLVCTPEISSLHLARERMYFLRSFDLGSRVSVVLNRCHKKALLKKTEVEELLGLPVIEMFPNDYHGVNQAIQKGTWVDAGSEMGKQFSAFAETLLAKKTPLPAERKRKFLEFFATPHKTLTTIEN
jgi:pilus assembly protein CpaE